jgi:hypothetical protein
MILKKKRYCMGENGEILAEKEEELKDIAANPKLRADWWDWSRSGHMIEEYRTNLIGILREFHESFIDFIEAPCISNICCIQF